MKNTLEEILGSMEPSELDELLPNNLKLKLPKKTLRHIEKTALEKSGITTQKRRRLSYKILVPAAACVVLSASLTGAAFAAEAKEYNTAMDFFAANGLSAEGLSRGDVKAVYRDITTNSFTNSKTAEVISRTVPGLEILQREPTPEEIANIWNHNATNFNTPKSGIEFQKKIDYKFDDDLGFDIFDKSTLKCYRGGELAWETEFSSFIVENAARAADGFVAWGYNYGWSSEQTTYSYIARLDENGNKLWERKLDHGFHNEYLASVIDNGDGTMAVITRGMIEHLCLSQYDMDGNELSFTKTNVGNRGIWNAARLGDGYLVQLGSYTDGENAHLVKLDRDGNITDNFIYESDDCDYYIKDMSEFEGKVYLSAYAVPKQKSNGGRYELADILEYAFTKMNDETLFEELTPMLRNNYTAVLLLCDPNGGEPETFYSVKGSLGGTLNVGENGLEWNVKSIVGAGYSPYTSAFSIAANCDVYRYTFNGSGALIECCDTGEKDIYRR